MSSQPMTDRTENQAAAALAATKHSSYSLWPGEKLQRNVLRSLPLTSLSSKENLPLWQHHSTCAPFQSKAPVLSAAPSLNVQRLRARPSLDIGIQKLACKQAENTVHQGALPRLGSKRRKSIHKRVISKVKEGVLNRSKSSSKFFGITAIDEHEDGNSRLDKIEHDPKRLVKSVHHGDVYDCTIDSTVKMPESGYSVRSMLGLGSSATSQVVSSGQKPNAIERVKYSSDRSPKVPEKHLYPVLARPNPVPVAIKLAVRPSSRHIGVDDGVPTWFTVTARAAGTTGEISGLILSVEAGLDGSVHNVLGPLSIPSMTSGEVTELRVKLSLKGMRKKPKRCDSFASTQSVFDDLCSELESMLGDALTELMIVKARYSHSMFPNETSLTTEYSLKVRVSDPAVPASFDHASVFKSTSQISKNASDDSLASAPSRTSSSKTHASTTDDDKTVHHNIQNASIPTQPSPDAARKVWNHIRQDSKSAADMLNLVPDRLEDNDTVAALQRQALANKRSVGAETLRDWQTMTGSYNGGWTDGLRLGHVPWL